MKQKLEITGVLMAGGKSSRMGKNKAFLELAGKPLVERTIEVLNEVCQEVLISSNDVNQYCKYGSVIPDRIKGKGPLGGLYSVLPHTKHELVFVTACDMPFITAEGIRLLYNEVENYDALVPYAQSRMHPLHAFYHRRILPLVEQHICNERLRLVEVLTACRTKILKVEEKFGQDSSWNQNYFVNANTPQEWDNIMNMMNTPD